MAEPTDDRRPGGGDNEPKQRLPVTFDLAAELTIGRGGSGTRKFPAFLFAGGGVFFVALGVLALLGRVSGGTALVLFLFLTAIAAFAIAVFGSRSAVTAEASELVIDDDGLRFRQPTGAWVRIDWSDLSFKVDLRTFSGEPSEVFPTWEPRRVHPQWVALYAPPRRLPKIQTTLPTEAMSAILRAAGEHGLTVRPVQVGFYWYHAVRGPGFLAYENAGDLQRAKEINGTITRLRGSAWKSYPDE
ncbi:MAG: hypothetical protein WB788_06950 [Thermoplasmata archaeon]